MPIIIDGMGSAARGYVVRTKDCIVKFVDYLSGSLLITYQAYLTLKCLLKWCGEFLKNTHVAD